MRKATLLVLALVFLPAVGEAQERPVRPLRPRISAELRGNLERLQLQQRLRAGELRSQVRRQQLRQQLAQRARALKAPLQRLQSPELRARIQNELRRAPRLQSRMAVPRIAPRGNRPEAPLLRSSPRVQSGLLVPRLSPSRIRPEAPLLRSSPRVPVRPGLNLARRRRWM